MEWKDFEKRVKLHSELQGITCIKIPELMVSVRGKSFRRPTEFDYCAGIDGISAFFDCKATAQSCFYFTTFVTSPGKLHQFNALQRASENLNIAGYLIYFYELKTVVWADISLVKSLIESGSKAITVDTPGISKQSDEEPINLRNLLWAQRSKIVKRM